MAQFKEFLVDAKKELKKVHWPDKPKVMETSMIVAGCTVVFAAFLWLVDVSVLQVFSYLLYR